MNTDVLKVQLNVLNILFVIIALSEGYQIAFGPCPLQIQEPCDAGAIKFYYYINSSYAEALDPFKPRLPSTFNTSADTKIIIHGYSGHMDYATIYLSKAYMEHGHTNIITVDWDLLSQLPCYPTATINTWQAGQCTAVLVISLAALGLDPKALHVLGFSLGAHVASYASNWIYSTMGVKFGRITGLDPALPFFATLNQDWKLDSDDAEFVDIIHSNSGIFGKIEATGHVDFYINGGSFQPACANHKNPPLCSHMLAPVYFAESISSTRAFRGVQCPGYIQYVLGWCRGSYANTAIMGDGCDKSARGIYFLDTADSPPFALG